MPIKVRCEDCGAGMQLPDAARGKSVKCKKCGSRVRIPGGKGGPRRKKKAAAPKADVHDDEFYSNIDLGRAEDEDTSLCPKCASVVTEEDIECPNCGINLETGLLSTKQQKRKKRGGPNPDLYYKALWKDSWAFFKKNWTLGIRLAMFWTIFATLSLICTYMSVVYCDRIPPKTFWGALAFIFSLGTAGAMWQLWIEVVKATVDGKDQLPRFNFDFFADVALGLKAAVWPLALSFLVVGPIATIVAGGYVAGMISQSDLQSPLAIGLGALLYVLPALSLPVAMCHLSAKYTFRAYIPYHMARLTLKNFGPVAWWWLAAFCVLLPGLGVVGAAGALNERVYSMAGDGLLKLVELCGIETADASRGFMFSLTAGGLGIVMIFLVILPTAMMICLPMLFLMRATGLLSFYFGRDIETGFKVNANEPAGFWVRYLAFLVDAAVINGIGFVLLGALLGFNAFLVSIEVDALAMLMNAHRAAIGIFTILYFVKGESGPSAATMGKKALGLVVIELDGKRPITGGAAFMRLIGRNIGMAIMGIGPAMCVWDKEQQTMHDKMTKTRVVWRGEIQ